MLCMAVMYNTTMLNAGTMALVDSQTNVRIPENDTLGVIASVAVPALIIHPLLIAITCIVTMLNILIGVPANILIFFAVYFNKALRTSMNALIVNLSVADIIICGVMSLLLLVSICANHKQLEDSYLCATLDFFHILGSSAQILTLMSISFERFQAIAHPFDKQGRLLRIRISLVMIWAISLSFAVISTTAFDASPMSVLCSSDSLHVSSLLDYEFGVYILVPTTFISIMGIMISYLRIILLVQRHAKNIEETLHKKRKNKVAPTKGTSEAMKMKIVLTEAVTTSKTNIGSKSCEPETHNSTQHGLHLQSERTRRSNVGIVFAEPSSCNVDLQEFFPGKTESLQINIQKNHPNVSDRTDTQSNVVNNRKVGTEYSDIDSVEEIVINEKGESSWKTISHKLGLIEGGDNVNMVGGDKAHMDKLPEMVNQYQINGTEEAAGTAQFETSHHDLGSNQKDPDSNQKDLSSRTSDTTTHWSTTTKCVNAVVEGNKHAVSSKGGLSLLNPSASIHNVETNMSSDLHDTVAIDRLAVIGENLDITKDDMDVSNSVQREGDRSKEKNCPSGSVYRQKAIAKENMLLSPYRQTDLSDDSKGHIEAISEHKYVGKERKSHVEETQVEKMDLANKCSDNIKTLEIGVRVEAPKKTRKSKNSVVEVCRMDGSTFKASTSREDICGSICVMNPANRERGKRKVEARTAKMTAIVIVTFLLCWLPFPIVILLISSVSISDSAVMIQVLMDAYLVSVCCALLASTINPIIYGVINKQFRKEFNKLIKRWKQLLCK